MKPRRAKNANYIDWRSSRAKKILLADLKSGKLPLDGRQLTAKEAFKIYKEQPEFKDVVFEQFQMRLRDHRKQVASAGGSEGETKKQANSTSGKDTSNYIDWNHSKAQKIIVDHLESGALPLDNKEISDEKAFELYKKMPQFEHVVFEQFKERLAAHRERILRKSQRSRDEAHAMEHDRKIYPVLQLDEKGRKRFFLDKAAKKLLISDLKCGKHKTVGVSGLRSTRSKYQEFEHQYFTKCVRQQICSLKFVNHLKTKRAKKLGLEPEGLIEY